MNLKGKVAIVSGGSRGIGRATSKTLAQRGAKVIVNYLNNQDAAQAVVDAIHSNGGEAAAFQADVRNESRISNLISFTKETFGGRIDILVNNANVPFVRKPFTKISWSEFAQKLNDELKAAFTMTKAVIPSMIEQEYGRIIYISSDLGKYPKPDFIAHGTAKGGIDTFAKYIASEFGPLGITANVVAPGATETDAISRMPEQVKQAFRKNTPLRRMAQPDDLAAVVSFLASDDSRFVTGSYTLVNGGMHME